MGTVVHLKNRVNNSYSELKGSVEDKLILVEEKIKSKLSSKVELVEEMTKYHLRTGGKKIRALLTLGSAKLCGYSKGSRDINLAACIELIHAATLMHDDVIDNSDIRRGKKTLNNIWGNKSSILVGDYLLSRCFEMMVEDGNLEILKLLSSTSAEISQGEVLQLQHRGEIDMLEETYLKIISAKTASLFSAATKVGSILVNKEKKIKDALEFYGKNLGLTFQIADDTLDYNSDLNIFGKETGNDFYEGKITLPIILPSIIAGWLLAFTISLDDLVVASFTTGPGANTLPIVVFSKVRLGLSPEVNALSAILMFALIIIGLFYFIFNNRFKH